jgi:plasmid maintenance system antidote protein VapI
LKEYIIRLEKKNNKFASEINIDPTELSQVINRRRRPTEKLIFRLEIHSNRNFPALMWFKLLEKDRAYELKHHKEIIDKERKNVKEQLGFSI